MILLRHGLLAMAAVVMLWKWIWAANLYKQENLIEHSVSEQTAFFGSLTWILLYEMIWFCSEQRVSGMRLADLTLTYVLLARIDRKMRIVPDSMLLLYLAGQFLLALMPLTIKETMSAQSAAMWEHPYALQQGRTIISGLLFGVVVMIFSGISGGRMGMGDAKLLGVTAMTAGWQFTFLVFAAALVFSCLYSLFLLIIQKKELKTEIPFVPFLFMGVILCSLVC